MYRWLMMLGVASCAPRVATPAHETARAASASPSAQVPMDDAALGVLRASTRCVEREFTAAAGPTGRERFVGCSAQIEIAIAGRAIRLAMTEPSGNVDFDALLVKALGRCVEVLEAESTLGRPSLRLEMPFVPFPIVLAPQL